MSLSDFKRGDLVTLAGDFNASRNVPRIKAGMLCNIGVVTGIDFSNPNYHITVKF